MGELSISFTVREGWTVVHVSGDIDISTERAVVEALEGRLLAGETRVVLDLGDVSFLDFSAAEALFVTRRMLCELHGALRLAAPTAQVMKTLTLTGLDRVFTIAPSVAAACEAD